MCRTQTNRTPQAAYRYQTIAPVEANLIPKRRLRCLNQGDSRQAGIQPPNDRFLIHIAADEDELIHPVAILRIPIALQPRFRLKETLQLICRSSGIPLPAFSDSLLHTSLLKEITHIRVIAEIADTLATDHTLRPLFMAEIVKLIQVKRLPHKLYAGRDPILLMVPVFIFVEVTVVMMVVVFIVIIVIIVVMVMLMLIVMIVMLVMLMLLT